MALGVPAWTILVTDPEPIPVVKCTPHADGLGLSYWTSTWDTRDEIKLISLEQP